MPDWRAYVRKRLPRLGCGPEREAEIVEELALQLEQVYRRATSAGASDEEARADVDAEVTDWDALAQTLRPGAAPVPNRGDTGELIPVSFGRGRSRLVHNPTRRNPR